MKWNKITDKLPENGQVVWIIAKDKFDCFPKVYVFVNTKGEYEDLSPYVAQYFQDFYCCANIELYIDEVLYWIDYQELKKEFDINKLFTFLGINES